MTGPYEPPQFDDDGNAIHREERDWPTTPPGEREPRWAYYVHRDTERLLRNAHETRHAAIGTASMFNVHFDDDPFHVVAQQTNGPMEWRTDVPTVCSWCDHSTTVAPLVRWVFADRGPYCSEECWVRDWHADGNEVQHEVDIR